MYMQHVVGRERRLFVDLRLAQHRLDYALVHGSDLDVRAWAAVVSRIWQSINNPQSDAYQSEMLDDPQLALAA